MGKVEGDKKSHKTSVAIRHDLWERYIEMKSKYSSELTGLVNVALEKYFKDLDTEKK